MYEYENKLSFADDFLLLCKIQQSKSNQIEISYWTNKQNTFTLIN